MRYFTLTIALPDMRTNKTARKPVKVITCNAKSSLWEKTTYVGFAYTVYELFLIIKENCLCIHMTLLVISLISIIGIRLIECVTCTK